MNIQDNQRNPSNSRAEAASTVVLSQSKEALRYQGSIIHL